MVMGIWGEEVGGGVFWVQWPILWLLSGWGRQQKSSENQVSF
jgi:hypothetical protein